jgi:hypothetical protein
MIHQCQQIIGKGRDADLLWRSNWPCLPVGAAIKAEQADSSRRTKQTEGLRHVRAQAVLEEKGDAEANCLIMKVNSAVPEDIGAARVWSTRSRSTVIAALSPLGESWSPYPKTSEHQTG